MPMKPRVALVAGVLALALTACGQERSVEAFCAVHDSHKDSYLTAFQSAEMSMESGDLIGGLLQAGIAVGDLSNMWKKLAKAAPEEIRTDTETVSDEWEKMADRAGDLADNPLKGIVSALGGAFKMGGPLQRIDAYVKTHCDA